MIRILFLFILISFFHAKTHHYQIKLMGINVAKVTMAHRDTIFANLPATIVEFTATTEAISNFIYPVDNHYKIIHSVNTHQVLSFKKTTIQPGLNNELFTEFNQGVPFYHNSQIAIPKKAITLFTLFHILAHNSLRIQPLIIEREGLLYDGVLNKINSNTELDKYTLNLSKNINSESMKLIEHTDIFTWAVFKENAKRVIWVNADKERIEKCKFNVGLFSITAEYLFTDE